MALVADNVELFYSDHGQGPPVLMLHGWTRDGADWSWLASDLTVDHRVVVVDFSATFTCAFALNDVADSRTNASST